MIFFFLHFKIVTHRVRRGFYNLENKSLWSTASLTALFGSSPTHTDFWCRICCSVSHVCSRVHESPKGRLCCLGGASSGEQDGRPPLGPEVEGSPQRVVPRRTPCVSHSTRCDMPVMFWLG